MIDVANEDPTTGDVPAVVMRGARGAAVRVTGLIEIGKGNERKTENEDTATATMTDTATEIEIKTMIEIVVDVGVKKTAMRHRKLVTRGAVARKVWRMPPLTPHPLLGTARAGVPRELIPGIVMVTDVPGILVILETNTTTHPGTRRIVGGAGTNAALVRKKIPFGVGHPRPQ